MKRTSYQKISLIAFLVIIVAAIIGILVWLFLAPYLESLSSEYDNKYVIRYYDNIMAPYDIEAKEDYIVVKKLEQPQCIQAPCNPIVVGKFRVDYTDEYRELFEKLFEGKDSKKISIRASEISGEERAVLGEIVR